MALTRITTAVIEDDAITATKMSNLIVDTGMIAAGAVTADKMAANTATDSPMSAAINLVQDNVNIVEDNVAAITDTTTDLTIGSAASGYFFDKSFTSLGINNTAPITGTVSLGTPANIILKYSTLGGNVIIGGVDDVTTYRLDVRGSANVGFFQAENANISGIAGSFALRSNVQGYIKTSTTTQTQLAYSNNVTSDIQTQLDSKAALAGATFTGEVVMNDDLIVDGNLTVHGDSTVANANSLVIKDNMIMLANGTTGTSTLDVGLLLNRGSQGNAFVGYDESNIAFVMVETKDPVTNLVLSPTSYANLVVGNVVSTTLSTGVTTTGAITATGITISGLTASKALQTDGSKGLQSSAVTTAELAHVSGVSSAIQTQIDTKIATTVSASNDFVTYTRLNANLNVVQDNINIVSDNVESLQTNLTANINLVQDNVATTLAGLLPFENVVTIASTANTFFVGKPYYTVSNVLIVTLDGINQSANLSDGTIQDFIVNATSTDASIIFTAPTIPIGTTIKTVTLFGSG